MSTVHVIDLKSGNLQSITNAVEHLGFKVQLVDNASDSFLTTAERLLLPGVGNFGYFMENMRRSGFLGPIREYIASGRPVMGICVGLQALFEQSAESPNTSGLGVIDMQLSQFASGTKPVPQIGWNSVSGEDHLFYGLDPSRKYYFVHSYAAMLNSRDKQRLQERGWRLATAKYGEEEFIAALAKDNIFATQFHPEKSGLAGLLVLRNFLIQQHPSVNSLSAGSSQKSIERFSNHGLSRRIIACLDVRTNDDGDLVVTKGDQYDVREKSGQKNVRNLGKPVELAQRYYEQGADEITFLNITSFKNCPLEDTPMLDVLKLAAKTIFIPLTVGGGIRDIIDTDGTRIPALDVASLYFRSGADKVSIGTDAVYAAEKYYAAGKRLDGTSVIETIAKAYGSQAVVISVDPKRVYVNSPDDTQNETIKTKYPDRDGRSWCWFQCTTKGGREHSTLGAWELVTACEALGAGEILLNSIDRDGSSAGYDLELLKHIKEAVNIPVVASSGAGIPEHFKEAFYETNVDACLGAGMFHNFIHKVSDVKEYLLNEGLDIRDDYHKSSSTLHTGN